MKKLIMFAATALVGLSLSAAQFEWSYDACGEFSDGALVYVFSGGSSIGGTLAALLTDEGADAFNSALSGYKYASDTLSSGTAGTGITISNVGASDYATVFVFQDGIVGGNTFAYYDGVDASGSIYTPPSGGTPLELWGDDPYTTGTIKTTGGGGGIPEPTSGLLLLVGGAMLALRRKRA